MQFVLSGNIENVDSVRFPAAKWIGWFLAARLPRGNASICFEVRISEDVNDAEIMIILLYVRRGSDDTGEGESLEGFCLIQILEGTSGVVLRTAPDFPSPTHVRLSTESMVNDARKIRFSVGGKAPESRRTTHERTFGFTGFQFNVKDANPAPLLSLRGGKSRKRSQQPLIGLSSAALLEVEDFRVRRVLGDGRCMFRALAQGVARNKEIVLSSTREEMEADNLRMAVYGALCASTKKIKKFENLKRSIEQSEDPMPRYCRRLKSPSFWGGEPELIVLSDLLKVPIIVYKEESEYGRSGTGFVKIVEYGTDSSDSSFLKPPVRLLYSGSRHYDLLLE